MQKKKKFLYIICGPTASGKTGLSHQLAKSQNNAVINADSMQIYKDLFILTACPEHELRQEVEYYLYNIISPAEQFSTIKYIDILCDKLRELFTQEKSVVLTGGTGMYLSMLLKGYNQIPDISNEVFASTNLLLKEKSLSYLYQYLLKHDFDHAKTLNPLDTNRIIRSFNILKQTGKSISYFWNQPLFFPIENLVTNKIKDSINIKMIYLSPNREFLYNMCNDRFTNMLDNGAIEEVESFIKLYPKLDNQASNALGLKEIASYLNNDISKDEAINLAQQKTRNYAKRQITWFNNQFNYDYVISYSNIDEYQTKSDNLIKEIDK